MKAISLSFLSFFVLLTGLQAQPGTPAATTKPARSAYTLQQQYNSLKYRSSSHKEFNHDYKVVRVDHLDKLMQNVQDSLRVREKAIKAAGKATEQALVKTRQELQEQRVELLGLKKSNVQKDQQIQKTAHDVASLSVFGLDMDKQVYVILSWLIIVGLGVLVGVFAYLYKRSKVVTDEKVNAFEEISKEYKEFKQNARDREIKIKRELQTEANKVEELNQQLAVLKKQVPT